jgi:hypothetical protein
MTSDGNGHAALEHRVSLGEAEQRSLRSEVRELRGVIVELCGKVDHLSTLVKASGEALEWLVLEKKARRKRKVAA